MFARTAGADAKVRHCRNHGTFPSLARWAVLILLACLTIVPASITRANETVRQEAPFPLMVDPATATDDVPATYEVLRGDFHMHTTYSDGSLEPVDRVIEAWKYGYDVIAITDHSNFNAYEHAVPMAEALGILLLRGMETGLAGNEHVVALGFSSDYVPRNPHNWAETEGQTTVYYQEQWPQLSAADGFALYAHPHVGLRRPMLWGINQGLLAGIEVKNQVVGSGWNTVASHGTYWYPFALDWAVEYNLAVFANSDVHGSRGPADQVVTLVLAGDRTRDAVMDAFRSRRTIAYFNNMLCSHAWVFEMVMPNLVDVGLAGIEGGRTFLRLQNYGPLELTAQVNDTPLAPIVLGPYQQMLIGLRRVPNDVAITWTNLYISSTENFTTTHTLATTDEPNRGSR